MRERSGFNEAPIHESGKFHEFDPLMIEEV